MAVTYREIIEACNLQTPRQKYYVGRRSFECDKSDVLALADEFWTEDFEDRSGPTMATGHTAPIVVKPNIVWHPKGMQGRAVVNVDYESHGVGFVRVYTRQYGRPFKVLVAPSGEDAWQGTITQPGTLRLVATGPGLLQVKTFELRRDPAGKKKPRTKK